MPDPLALAARAVTCQKDIYHGGWSYSSSSGLCGKPAKWVETFGGQYGQYAAGSKRVLCGLHGYQAKHKRYFGNKVEPLDPNGCPLCATSMLGAAPSRTCPSKNCSYDEAFAIKGREAAEAYKATVEVRKAACPFNRGEMAVTLEKINDLVRQTRDRLMRYGNEDNDLEALALRRKQLIEAVTELDRLKLSMD